MASNKGNQSEKKGKQHEPEEWSWDNMAACARFDEAALGEGATAVVYRGYKGDQEYAIKVITLEPPKEDENSHGQQKVNLMSQWKNEVKYLTNNKFFHKNIVKLIAYGQEIEHEVNGQKQERWFLVYERLECSLKKQIKELTWKQVLTILKSTAEVLHFLHEKNVIHNDLKPENLLLDKHFNIKLGDFGGATGSGQYAEFNTPGYHPVASRHRAANATPASDAYSFGVCSLQLLMRMEKVEEDPTIIEMANKKKLKQGHVVDNQLLQSEGCNKEAAIQVTEVALSCCKEWQLARPTMRKVADELTRLLAK